MILNCCLMILKCCVCDFERLFNDFEMSFNDLSSSSNNLGSEKNYKGAGRFSTPPPFVGLLSHKLFRQLLKSLKLISKSLNNLSKPYTHNISKSSNNILDSLTTCAGYKNIDVQVIKTSMCRLRRPTTFYVAGQNKKKQRLY